MKALHKMPSWLQFAAIALLALFVACHYSIKAADSTVPPSIATASPRLTASPTTALPSQLNKLANSALLVDLRSVNPAIRLDLRYATTNNFMRRPLYKQSRCLLRASVAEQLGAVQKALEKEGLGLKVYDCYRPLSVQKQMWKLFPDDRYVANPARGSRHNRGSAVDVTLVDRRGKELTMPTGFDDFTEQAATNYDGASPQAKQNRQRLKDVMTQHGFTPLQSEWWHFDAASWAQFPVLDIPLEAVL
ncbi:MAG: D-alanyl-D-alanine dipeptidase [Stenomitos frigidus ULC029]